MADLSEEAIQLRGDHAKALLENETMVAAITHVSAHLQNSVMSTKLDETEKRDAIFATYKGLQEVVAMLKKWEAAAAVSRDNQAKSKG